MSKESNRRPDPTEVEPVVPNQRRRQRQDTRPSIIPALTAIADAEDEPTAAYRAVPDTHSTDHDELDPPDAPAIPVFRRGAVRRMEKNEKILTLSQLAERDTYEQQKKKRGDADANADTLPPPDVDPNAETTPPSDTET